MRLNQLICCFAEIKIRSSAKSKELTMHCSDCWPRELTVIPWCPLLLEDTSNPPSTAYFQLHKLDPSKGETVDGVYHKYEERVPNLKCLFVIAPSKEVHSLSNWLTGNPFLLVIIPEKHKKKILELCDSELEATIAVEYTESSKCKQKIKKNRGTKTSFELGGAKILLLIIDIRVNERDWKRTPHSH